MSSIDAHAALRGMTVTVWPKAPDASYHQSPWDWVGGCGVENFVGMPTEKPMASSTSKAQP